MQKKNPSNRDIQFRKINYHKHKQSKIMEPQAKIETKNLKNINNEIPSDYYSYRQLNIKVLNNFNNEHFITDCKNFDSNTLNKQNVKYTRNISTSKISINNNNFYNNHNYTKSNFFLNKIPNLIANERTEENKYLNISYNNIINRINKYNKITYSKQKMLPNNMYNKNTNIINPKLNHIIQKKLTSIKPSGFVKKNIYKKANNLTNYSIDVANDKKNSLLKSVNINKISVQNYVHNYSTPTLKRNPPINFRGKQIRLFK